MRMRVSNLKQVLSRVAVAVVAMATTPAIAQEPSAEHLFAFEAQRVSIPMADGARLSALLLLPGPGRFPAVVTITQASLEKWRESHLPRSSFSRSGDFAVVAVNTRGKRASRDSPPRGGTNPFGQDGYDVVEWVARQDWSNGRVGMWGGSNEGKNQYATAQAAPPHLVCIMPALTTPDTKEDEQLPRSYEQLYMGGVLRHELIDRLPPSSAAVRQVLSHPLDDPSFWKRRDPDAPTVADIEVPVMAISAWFDNDVNRAGLRTFEALRSAAGEELRERHRLLIAPWIHNSMFSDGLHGQLRFDNTAEFYRQQEKRFFDHWLRRIDNGEPEAPAITYYQMGSNEWRTTRTWPPSGVRDVSFYLHSDGSLSLELPASEADPVIFKSDPDNPVPTVGGQNKTDVAGKGPHDQRHKAENHADAVLFSSPPLEENLEITGDLELRFHLSSDAEDTDVAFRLTDVHPDGRSMLLRDGILRLSLRKSFGRYEFLTPGEIYSGVIETIPVAHTFLRGHRVRLIISGSNYPRWAMGGNTRDKDDPPKVAQNALHLDLEHPTALILPVQANGR